MPCFFLLPEARFLLFGKESFVRNGELSYNEISKLSVKTNSLKPVFKIIRKLAVLNVLLLFLNQQPPSFLFAVHTKALGYYEFGCLN